MKLSWGLLAKQAEVGTVQVLCPCLLFHEVFSLSDLEASQCRPIVRGVLFHRDEEAWEPVRVQSYEALVALTQRFQFLVEFRTVNQ